MEKKYIPLERTQSVEENETTTNSHVSFPDVNSDNLLGDAKPKIITSEEMSKRVKRVLSRPMKKLTSALRDYKRKSKQSEVVFGYCAATGVSVCSVNPAFC